MRTSLSDLQYYDLQMYFLDNYMYMLSSGIEPRRLDKARLARVTQLQAQQSIHFLDDFLAVTPGHELQTTRIGYWPIKGKAHENISLAPAGNVISGQDRRLTRNRLVYGPVDFYLRNQLEFNTTIPVISACAPNLMGTSAIDLAEFSEGGANNRQLNAEAYQNECVKIAQFIVGSAKQHGHVELIMPAFGVGVYINKLGEASRQLATKIMYESFAQAAYDHQIDIKWIVWAGETGFKDKVRLLQKYSNGFMQPVVASDMLTYAQGRLSEGVNAVMLNPGSDRTIGGMYGTKNPKTLEEQIAQKSDLVLLHTEFNQPMVEKFNAEFAQRKQNLSSDLAEHQDANLKSKPSQGGFFSPRFAAAPNDIVRKYFGTSNTLDGIFGRYIEERAENYWFKDLIATFFLGNLGFKTDQAEREAFLYKLKDVYAQGDKNKIQNLISEGKEQFTPRSREDSEYKKSLCYKLEKLEAELSLSEAEPERPSI